MREKYESLSVAVLRDVAKSRGLRHLSGLKKSELVELMLEEDKKDVLKEENAEGDTEEKAEAGTEQKPEEGTEAKAEAGSSEAAGEAEGHAASRSQEKVTRTKGKAAGGAEEKIRARAEAKALRTEGKAPLRAEGQTLPRTEARASARVEDRPGQAGERKPDARSLQGREERMHVERNIRTERVDVSERQERKTGKIITADGIEIDNPELDSGISAHGILEVMPDGYGFIRCANYLPGENDVYVSPSQIRKFGLKTGDIVQGNTRVKTQQEKFSALLYIRSINGCHPSEILRRSNFEDLTPIFPNERIRLETDRSAVAMRIMDVVSPIGKGQRGMIVSPPKAGKTTLLKQVAKAVTRNNPQMHLIILLIDERPEEVTDIKEAIEGKNVEVIYSTFDELPEHHKRVSEMVIERARRLVEHKKDVMILLDSITRLARAYNLIVPPSGRTLSGGIDPAALHMPKRFFGAARNMREGGSITILATALVDTGSRMDDVIYEEFKGTGNMELILDRKLSERRIFPAVDITKSGTRREDLLLNREEQEAVEVMRRAINGMRADDAVETILNLFVRTNNNHEFCQMIKKTKLI
ncbi:MAG: transcription termination factor Rho [Lachnospiraceae bacterium]|nr:transcription termination factor Rho [Lachnospiraceae bacterium]